jgi:hypothetical protein
MEGILQVVIVVWAVGVIMWRWIAARDQEE